MVPSNSERGVGWPTLDGSLRLRSQRSDERSSVGRETRPPGARLTGDKPRSPTVARESGKRQLSTASATGGLHGLHDLNQMSVEVLHPCDHKAVEPQRRRLDGLGPEFL